MPPRENVLLIAGSPSSPSRSTALLSAVGERLSRHGGLVVGQLDVRSLPAEALLLADWKHPAIVEAIARVAAARAVVVATPVYKAAYSGVLKVFLDLLPQHALKDKTVLPLATGGSPHHMLALDYALRPVLQSLSARHILPGVYASDAQLSRSDASRSGYTLGDDIRSRIDDAAANLLLEGFRLPQPVHHLGDAPSAREAPAAASALSAVSVF